MAGSALGNVVWVARRNDSCTACHSGGLECSRPLVRGIEYSVPEIPATLCVGGGEEGWVMGLFGDLASI